MNLFWGPGIYGSYGGGAAHVEAASASAKARSAKTDVKALEDRLDRAMLACEAMWMLLRKKLDIRDEDLADQIMELDLSDGKLDGKVRKAASTCPKCQRKSSPRFDKCMYCETPIESDPFA